MKNYNIAIEIGSSNTIIYRHGFGVVLKESSILAVESSKDKEVVVAVGEEAKKLIGKTNKNIDLIYPINEGVIKNLTCAQKMLEAFFKKIDDKKFFARKHLVFSVPCGLTRSEQENYKNLGYLLNANSVHLIPSVFFALYGMSLDGFDRAKVIVNMGGAIADIAVIANNEIISGCTVAMGNNSIENKIIDEIMAKYGIEISRRDAEDVKMEISTLLPNDIIEVEVVGVDINTSETRMIKVHSQDFLNVFMDYYSIIVDGINAVIKACPVELREEIANNGISVCGGNATINGLERFLRGRLNMPIHISSDPKLTSVNGISKLFKNPGLLEKIIKKSLF